MAITITNIFVAGTKIEASPMNANFAEVANAVDKRGDTVTGNIAANAGVKFDGVDLSTIPNSSGTFDPLFAQVVIGTADTNGIRLDLETGTLAVREGDDSAYAPLITGLLTTSGNHVPASNDGGSLGISGTAWADAFLASGGVLNWDAGNITLTHSAGKLTLSGSGAGTLDVKGAILPTANDGAALGASGTAWADLFLASGGVVNWNAGDITVTHASGKLTLAGSGAGTLEVKGAILPTVSNTPALGSTSLTWADLFLGDGAIINFNNGDVTVTHSTNTLAFAGASTGYTFADGPITNALGAVGTPSYTFSGDLNTGFWSPAADTVAVSTGGTERMRIPSTGGVQCKTTLSVGDVAPATSGAGITFPATQSASSDANTLDDYEEGTYTATLTPTTSGSLTLNSSFDTLQYTKVGRVVHVSGHIKISTDSSPVGNTNLNLPFTVASLAEDAGGFGTGVTWSINGSFSATPLAAYANGGASSLTMIGAFSSPADLWFSFSYVA